MGKAVKTPTLDKLLSVKPESQVIGRFLEWLAEHECEIASYDPVALQSQQVKLAAALGHQKRSGRDLLIPVNFSIEKMLALYFEIDLDAAERERVKLLEHMRRDDRYPEVKVNRGDKE